MAYSIGQDTGYKKSTGGANLGTSSLYMKQLQEEIKKQQLLLQAQQAAALRARSSRESAAAYNRASQKSYLERYANPLNDKGQTPQMAGAMGNYSDWYESGAKNLAPILDPNNVYQGKLRPEYGQPYQAPWGETVDKMGYVYDEKDPRRKDYEIKDYQNADLRPDQVLAYQSPGILPDGGSGSGGGGGYGDYPWEYPVYSYGGGGAKKINEWYANMVQWNINRPKGG